MWGDLMGLRMREKMRGIKKTASDKVDDYKLRLDSECQMKYLKKIQKEDGVSYEEAVRLTQEDPKYSLGWKLCSPDAVTDMMTESGRRRIKRTLTPEELEIFERDVEPMGLRKIVTGEIRRQVKEKKGKK